MDIKIDKAKGTATITVKLNETPILSSSGDTSAIAEKVNNQDIGQVHSDGRAIKLSLNLYVKTPKIKA
jgi:hypothetical protein